MRMSFALRAMGHRDDLVVRDTDSPRWTRSPVRRVLGRLLRSSRTPCRTRAALHASPGRSGIRYEYREVATANIGVLPSATSGALDALSPISPQYQTCMEEVGKSGLCP